MNRNPHSHFLPIVLILTVTLLIGLAGGYVLSSGKFTFNSQNNIGQSLTNSIMQVTPTINPQISIASAQIISGWMTYENKQLGISFQYPPDWVIVNPFSGSPPSPDLIGLIPINKQQNLKGTVSPIYIEHWANPKNLSLQAFETDQDSQPNRAISLDLYTPQLKPTLFEGLPAYFQQHAGCEPVSCEKMVVLEKNNIFAFYNVHLDFSDLYSTQELQSYEGIFNKVLSTVKFTNQ